MPKNCKACTIKRSGSFMWRKIKQIDVLHETASITQNELLKKQKGERVFTISELFTKNSKRKGSKGMYLEGLI